MALHRDILWVGRQWAVTGAGMQAVDQKRRSQFDIEASRLWEDGLLESMLGQEWLNRDDFEKGLAVARKHYPEPPRKAAAREESVSPLQASAPVVKPKPVARTFDMRIESCRAKFVRPWRVRTRR